MKNMVLVLMIIVLKSSLIIGQSHKELKWIIPPTYKFWQAGLIETPNKIILYNDNKSVIFSSIDSSSIHCDFLPDDIISSTDSIFFVKKGNLSGVANWEGKVLKYINGSRLTKASNGFFHAKNSSSDSTIIFNIDEKKPFTKTIKYFTVWSACDEYLLAQQDTMEHTFENGVNSKVYNYEGELILAQEGYSLNKIEGTCEYFSRTKVGDFFGKESIVNIKGELIFDVPENASVKFIEKYFKIDVFGAEDYFLDQEGQKVNSIFAHNDKYAPIKIVMNCDDRNLKKMGIQFLKKKQTISCSFHDIDTSPNDTIIRATDEDYQTTVFDIYGNKLYKGQKLEGVWPLGDNLFCTFPNVIHYAFIENRKFGVKNKDGETILPSDYTNIRDFSPSCQLLSLKSRKLILIAEPQKVSLFSTKGKLLKEHAFETVDGHTHVYKDFFITDVDDHYKLFNHKGEILKRFNHKRYHGHYKNRFVVLGENEKYSLLDMESGELILKDYPRLRLLEGGFLLVKEKDLYGIISIN